MRTTDDRIVVVYGDVPGAFSRIAGVLSLHGLDVITARAHSDEPQPGMVAMGASEYRVHVPRDRHRLGADPPRPRPRRPRRAGDRGPPRRAGPHVPPPAADAGRSARAAAGDRSTTRRRPTATVIEVRCTDQDRHPAPHHQGARRGRARHPPRHGADDRARGRRHVLRAQLVGRAHRRPVPPRRDRARRAPRRRADDRARE